MHFGITIQKWMDVNNSYQCYIDIVNVGDFENSVIFQVEDISIWPHRYNLNHGSYPNNLSVIYFPYVSALVSGLLTP